MAACQRANPANARTVCAAGTTALPDVFFSARKHMSQERSISAFGENRRSCSPPSPSRNRPPSVC